MTSDQAMSARTSALARAPRRLSIYTMTTCTSQRLKAFTASIRNAITGGVRRAIVGSPLRWSQPMGSLPNRRVGFCTWRKRGQMREIMLFLIAMVSAPAKGGSALLFRNRGCQPPAIRSFNRNSPITGKRRESDLAAEVLEVVFCAG